jgi:hypothetical protein
LKGLIKIKKTYYIIGIILILFLLVITNPTKSDYNSWLRERYISQTNNPIESGVVSLLGPSLIDQATTSKNLVFISIYKTNLDNENETFIGIMKNFISINPSYSKYYLIFYLIIVNVIIIIVGNLVLKD